MYYYRSLRSPTTKSRITSRTSIIIHMRHESAISCYMLASSVMAMPLPLAVVAAVLVFSLSADLVNCQRYIVPEARLEFQNPRGLKISIPGE